ncbi:MAG: ferritin-like domain-containing protein [Bacillota bacterium]
MFQFAIDFEKENREYYLERAENTDNEYLKSLFENLAGEEKKHEEIIKQLMEDEKVDYVESDLIDNAKKAFDEIAAELPDNILPTEEVHIYKQAVEMEKRSREYYKEKAEESELEHVEKVFLQLAKEEEKHQQILENIEKMVDRPNTWLDDAEWYHMEDY